MRVGQAIEAPVPHGVEDLPTVGDASLVLQLPGEDFPLPFGIWRRDSAVASGRDVRTEAEVRWHMLTGVDPLAEAEVRRHPRWVGVVAAKALLRRGLLVETPWALWLPSTLPPLARVARMLRLRGLRRLLVDDTGVRLDIRPCLHGCLCQRALVDGVEVGPLRRRCRLDLSVVVGAVRLF
jgi:hypothetical protein